MFALFLQAAAGVVVSHPRQLRSGPLSIDPAGWSMGSFCTAVHGATGADETLAPPDNIGVARILRASGVTRFPLVPKGIWPAVRAAPHLLNIASASPHPAVGRAIQAALTSVRKSEIWSVSAAALEERAPTVSSMLLAAVPD